jgi:predicted RNA-binding protein with PUA-like domain
MDPVSGVQAIGDESLDGRDKSRNLIAIQQPAAAAARLVGAILRSFPPLPSLLADIKAIRMAFWLMKSEPASYGWSDLIRDGGTEWDGVRNPTARIHLRAMKVGDQAFLYHSMSDKAVVGIMRVTREAAPDPKNPDWVSVRVEPIRPLPKPVTLAEIKAEPRLAKMELIRQSRLSVAPVREEEWKVVLELAKGSAPLEGRG